MAVYRCGKRSLQQSHFAVKVLIHWQSRCLSLLWRDSWSARSPSEHLAISTVPLVDTLTDAIDGSSLRLMVGAHEQFGQQPKTE